MSQIWSIAAKDLKLLVRDKAGLFWVIGFPLLIAILFGSIFGGESAGASKMKIAIDDQDKSDSSKSFVQKLRDSSAVSIRETPFAEAQNSVRKGDIVAVVQIPKGFGESSIFSGQQPALKVAIDPARKAEAGFLKGILAEASFAPMQDMFSNPAKAKLEMEKSRRQVSQAMNLSSEEKQSLIKFLGSADQYFSSVQPAAGGPKGFSGPKIEEVNVTPQKLGPDSAYEITFPQGIIWGLVAVAMAFAVGTVKERVGGTYMRLKIAPISRGAYLAGKALACFLGCVGVIALLLGIGRLIFHLHFPQPSLMALAVISSSICFVGITMFLSVISKSEDAASGAGRAVLLLFSMFGGAMIPQIVMPPWMLAAASFSPVKWAILALEGAMWRSFDLQEMLLPCGILLGVGVAGFLGGSVMLAKTKD